MFHGAVWETPEKSAVKRFYKVKQFEVERDAYIRLKSRRKRTIGIFKVPELLAYNDDLMVVEMTIVEPPYLLDFGKTYIDEKPPYAAEEEIMREYRKKLSELFGERLPAVRRALAELESIGIY